MSAKIKSLHVEGRRWFDRINGNTYCAAKVYIDGAHVITTDWQYGYGDFYQQAAGRVTRLHPSRLFIFTPLNQHHQHHESILCKGI